jgi:hypothetical protein
MAPFDLHHPFLDRMQDPEQNHVLELPSGSKTAGR